MAPPDDFIENIPEIAAIRSEAIEFAQIGLYRYRFDGSVVFLDSGAMRIFEIEDLFDGPASVSGMNIAQLIKYTDEPGKLREQIRKHKRVRGFEYRFKTLRGKEKCVLHDSYIVPGKTPEEDAIQVIVHDITEQKQAQDAMKASEEKYRVLSEEIADGVVVMIDGKCVWANKAASSITGFSVDEMYGRGIDIFIVAEEVPVLKERMKNRALGSCEPETYESMGVNRNGGRVYVEISAKRITFEGCKAVQIVLRNISGRKKIENDLRLRAREFQSIFDAFPDLYFRFDANGVVLDARAGRETDFYVPPSGFIGKSILDVMPLDISRKVKDMIDKTLMTGRMSSLEYCLEYPDGKRYFESRLVPIFDRQVIGFVRDITERVDTEIQLKESERFLAGVFESIQDGISVLDTDLQIMRVNPTMEKWYSHSRPLESKKCYYAYHGKSEPCEVCPSLRAIKTGKAASDVVPLTGAWKEINGWLELFAFPLHEPGSDKVIGVIEYVRDISARRKAEDELKAYQGKLEELVEKRTVELRSAQEKLIATERLATLGQFAGGISHEIRNPLNVIAATVYYLKRKVVGEEGVVPEHLDKIKKQVDRCTQIIESILRLTQMRPPQLELTDLNEFIGEFSTSLSVPGDILMENSFPKEHVTARIDREQLRMALKNLCSNSIQAMPDGGRMSIKLQKVDGRDGSTLITVEDTGNGIKDDDLQNVFQPLFTTKAKGIGFGLAIVKMIIERHGGEISVESEYGKGARFTISLPAMSEEV